MTWLSSSYSPPPLPHLPLPPPTHWLWKRSYELLRVNRTFRAGGPYTSRSHPHWTFERNRNEKKKMKKRKEMTATRFLLTTDHWGLLIRVCAEEAVLIIWQWLNGMMDILIDGQRGRSIERSICESIFRIIHPPGNQQPLWVVNALHPERGKKSYSH